MGDMQSLLAFLQIAASLLASAQSSQTSDAIKIKAVASATQTIGFVSQSLLKNNTPQSAQTPKANLWPTAEWLWNALYLNREGAWVSYGAGVRIIDNSISFGDMNGDFLDDGIVVTKNVSAKNPADVTYRLAVMANQGGSFANIANFNLGKTQPTIYSHEIEAEVFTIDMEARGKARAIYKYKLLGNTLVEI